MSVLTELKSFMTRGNVVDMAVGVVTGAAFGKIVTSLVNDIIMPPIGVLIGGVNFTELKFILSAAVGDKDAVTLNYGSFLQTILDFIIISTAIFFAIKGINKLRKEEKKPEPAPEPVKITKEEELLSEIRDLLKQNNK